MPGPFDAFAPKLMQTLIGTFVPTPKAWVRRVADAYDPVVGTDPVTTTNGVIKTGVPAPFATNRVDGKTILSTDMAVVVADLDIQESGFDPFPADDATVLVTIDGIEYKVIAFRDYKSGDLTAGYEFQLRK